MRSWLWFPTQDRAEAPAQEQRPRQPPPIWRQPSAATRCARRGARRAVPRRAWRRWGCGGVVLLLVLLAVACTHLSPQPQEQAATTGAAQTPASPHARASAQASAPPTRQPSPTPAAPAASATSDLAGLPPTLVATRFLVAYFTWQLTDSDAAYVQRWQPYVEPSALALLIKNAPRLLLDGGADGAANGEALQAPPGVPQAGSQMQLSVTWTVQVWPAGGELAQFQPRQIHTTLALIQRAGQNWQVGGLTWTSSADTGGAS